MTLPIHDQGGLTEAEIKLAIEESAERREAALDAKLAAHRTELKAELARTDQTVAETNKTVTAMQRELGGLAAETASQTKLLEEMRDRGNDWHAADLAFRADITSKVGKLETEHMALTLEAKRLKWIGLTVHGLGKATHFVIGKICELDVWKVVIFGVVIGLMKALSPALYQLVVVLTSGAK